MNGIQVIDNTTDKIEKYTNGTVICGIAFAVITDDIHVLFDTAEEAEEYAQQFAYYTVEPVEYYLDSIDGCVYDPASVLAEDLV